jgi:hypothetical protein
LVASDRQISGWCVMRAEPVVRSQIRPPAGYIPVRRADWYLLNVPILTIFQQIETFQIGLGVTIPLLCALEKPADCFLVILRHSMTDDEQPPQVVC